MLNLILYKTHNQWRSLFKKFKDLTRHSCEKTDIHALLIHRIGFAFWYTLLIEEVRWGRLIHIHSSIHLPCASVSLSFYPTLITNSSLTTICTCLPPLYGSVCRLRGFIFIHKRFDRGKYRHLQPVGYASYRPNGLCPTTLALGRYSIGLFTSI